MVFAILLRFVDHNVRFFPMVVNYWPSEAVFVEGLNNKEDVNDKVNKRVDGIMDPFKEVLNLLRGISSISKARQGKAPAMKMSGRRGGKTNKLISRSPHRSNVPQLSIVAQLFQFNAWGESNCIFFYSICCPPPHSVGYPIGSYDR